MADEPDNPYRGQPNRNRSENEAVRKPLQSQGGEAQDREGQPAEGRTPREEDLLRDQELSLERQREGHGWASLEPGETRGTTPVSKNPPGGGDEATEGEGRKATPSAHRAETQGQRTPEAEESREKAS